MKKVVWLVAGTSEGRRLAGALADLGVTVHVTVATEYGASLYPDRPNIHVYAKRMTYDDMCAFLREKDPELVLDSSHPYAKIVTETVHRACTDLGYEYKRMLRPSTPHPDCIDVHNFEEAVEFLSDTEGPIFLTTGSKNLVDFAKLPGYQERVTCRILPLQGSLENAPQPGLSAFTHHLYAGAFFQGVECGHVPPVRRPLYRFQRYGQGRRL
jgi:precorrin-6A/cobalt-precorrin-6A reductase